MNESMSRAPSTRSGVAIFLLLIALILGAVGLLAFYEAGKGERTPAMICGGLLAPRGGTTAEYEACLDEESQKTPFDAAVPWWVASAVALITAGLVAAVYPDRQ